MCRCHLSETSPEPVLPSHPIKGGLTTPHWHQCMELRNKSRYFGPVRRTPSSCRYHACKRGKAVHTRRQQDDTSGPDSRRSPAQVQDTDALQDLSTEDERLDHDSPLTFFYMEGDEAFSDRLEAPYSLDLIKDLDNEHALDRSKSLDSPLYPLYWVEAGLERLARIEKESAGMQSEEIEKGWDEWIEALNVE